MAKETSKIDRVLQLLEELEKTKQGAIDELLAQRKEIDDQLAKLGYGDKPRPTPTKRTTDPSKPCSYCGQVGHDARKHRAEIIAAKKKK